MIPPKTIQEIFETAKVKDVVEDFVKLTRRGINYIGLCPFHHEKTPSFTVSPAKNIYKCFGCSEGGNPVNFIMAHEQLSYPEAMRYLAKKYGIHIEEEKISEEYKAQLQLADNLYVVSDFAQTHYQTLLFENDYGRSVGLSYFKERGFREETVRKFGLGFANGQNSDFTKLALKKGYELQYLKKAGLATKYDKDFFRNRVMFPIHNLSGKVIGFGGRILTSDKKQPKYLNTPESDIYNKSKSLYGIYFARKAIVKADECYLVEGYTDVISLHQSGIENVVASSGTALTIGQIQLVKRYAPNITILYDGDAAGIKAATRGLDMVLEQGMNVRVVLLPTGEDPDSYLKRVGAAAFKEYIDESATDFILFKAKLLLEQTKNDPIKRAELITDIVKTVSKIPDSLKRSVYVRECSALLGIQEQILHIEINKRLKIHIKKRQDEDKKKQQPKQQKRPQQQNFSDGDMPPPPEDFGPSELEEEYQGETISDNKLGKATDEFQERDMVRILINFGDKPLEEDETVAEYILMNMLELLDEFDNAIYAGVMREYMEALEAGETITTDYFIRHQDPKIAKLAVHVIATPYEYSEGWEKMNVYLNTQKMPELNHIADAKSGVIRFKLKKIERLINKNHAELKQLQDQKGDYNKVIKLMKVHKKLVELRTELATEFNTVVLR
ncbi:MAG: DNA primase [Aureispira sp.]|nr:DNA primase [Aureispira sp.]